MAGKSCARLLVIAGFTRIHAAIDKLGLTPQKPLQRAYQRDPEAIEKWQREQFPAIAREAKASGGVSGMSPGSARMPCTAEPGARRDKHLWSSAPVSGNRLAPLPQ